MLSGWIDAALTTLFGQPRLCSSCGKLIREKRRKPCPRCGSTARTHQRFVEDGMGAKDKAG